MRRTVGLAIAIAAAAWPAAAAAQDTSSCRASAARVTVPSLKITVEPVRANAPAAPCSDQSASTLATTTIGPVTAAAVGAFTAKGPTGGGTALASAGDVDIVLGGLTVNVDALQAEAKADCTTGTPVLSGSSRVVNLTINGQVIALPPGNEPFELDLGPIGKLQLNSETVEAGVLTRRALALTTPIAEIVLAEAIAGATSCGTGADGGGGGGGGEAAPNPCPPGATYDPARNVCVVRESGGTAGATDVGRPFEGPSGGTVVALDEARKRYRSPCLRGAGPRYAIVGTNGRDRITGTNGRDRILLLRGRDHAEGGRGNDCIDGGAGVDTMSGALGADRLYGGSGIDHLVGGSHADRLSGGSGNDTINTGYGKDRVMGGSGADRINAATAGVAALQLDCGSGRDKIRVNRNEGRRVRRCETVHIVR